VTRKKNILLISPFFYPEKISTGKFNTKFAEGLLAQGHGVTVLCFHPFYPNWKVKRSTSKIKDLEIVRGGRNICYTKKTIFRRLILEVSFAFFVLRNIRNCLKDKDIVIPIFPPSLAFCVILSFINKRIRKVGMVHDLQEVYTEGKTGFINNIVRILIHEIEKKCYQSCDKVLFLSNEMKSEAKRLYHLVEDRLEVQYPFITLTDRITNDLSTVFNPDLINVVYSGALGEKQRPEALYNFFSVASERIENTVFHFFSGGEAFRKLKRCNKNNKIFFHNLVDIHNLEELYLNSSVQIIPQKENSSKGSLPSKLPNILVSGCKVLLITDVDSEIEIFFKNNNLEIVSTSWDIDILIEKLNLIILKKINVEHQKLVASKNFTISEMIFKVLR
jgi:glycosyltransferase involved in cell wall biosynthesis